MKHFYYQNIKNMLMMVMRQKYLFLLNGENYVNDVFLCMDNKMFLRKLPLTLQAQGATLYSAPQLPEQVF